MISRWWVPKEKNCVHETNSNSWKIDILSLKYGEIGWYFQKILGKSRKFVPWKGFNSCLPLCPYADKLFFEVYSTVYMLPFFMITAVNAIMAPKMSMSYSLEPVNTSSCMAEENKSWRWSWSWRPVEMDDKRQKKSLEWCNLRKISIPFSGFEHGGREP